MKKIFMVFIFALIAMTYVFAANVRSSGKVLYAADCPDGCGGGGTDDPDGTGDDGDGSDNPDGDGEGSGGDSGPDGTGGGDF